MRRIITTLFLNFFMIICGCSNDADCEQIPEKQPLPDDKTIDFPLVTILGGKNTYIGSEVSLLTNNCTSLLQGNYCDTSSPYYHYQFVSKYEYTDIAVKCCKMKPEGGDCEKNPKYFELPSCKDLIAGHVNQVVDLLQEENAFICQGTLTNQ